MIFYKLLHHQNNKKNFYPDLNYETYRMCRRRVIYYLPRQTTGLAGIYSYVDASYFHLLG